MPVTAPASDLDLDVLREQFRGRVISPTDGEYETARRPWNGMIDRHPGVIAQCVEAADVVAAVNFAREQGLPVSIRGGGHNVAGTAICDHGVVIDLSLMRGVRVDPDRRVVRAEGGALLGDIDREAQAFGLAVPVGVVSRTGVAGLSLHGGMGFLTRKYGLTSDNLLAADVVTADGQLLTTDEHQHPDLLWALKGGGGNFGVVTSFEFQAHPVGPDVWLGLVLYPVELARECLRFFREHMASAPDELSAIALLWNAPTEEPIPEPHRGAPVCVLAACYCGPLEEGERAIQPFRELGDPVADLSGVFPYVAAQQLFDADYPDGWRYYWKSIFLESLSDEVMEALIEYAERRPSPITSLDVWAFGGAVHRVAPEATAFSERRASFLIGIESNWHEPEQDEANVAWAREVFRDLQRFSSRGAYLNFPGFGEEGEKLLERSYGANLDRLKAVKARYDPSNFFRHNLNIRSDSTPAVQG